MLKKTRSRDTGNVKVTFVLTPQASADRVHLVGDFNDWQGSTPMRRQRDGSWRATVEVEAGRAYQFRYLVDGNVWVNDEAADAYVPNPFGADNCVVRTPGSVGGRGAELSVSGSHRGSDRRGGTGTVAKGRSGDTSRGSGGRRGAERGAASRDE
jgi:hypothetical protein